MSGEVNDESGDSTVTALPAPDPVPITTPAKDDVDEAADVDVGDELHDIGDGDEDENGELDAEIVFSSGGAADMGARRGREGSNRGATVNISPGVFFVDVVV
jgi:hypothetical protein